MQRVARYLFALSLAVTLGLHWTALQSIAWASMLARHLVEAPLSTALTKTFDGKHPCRLCLAVAEGRRSQQPADELGSTYRPDLCLFAAEPMVVLVPANSCTAFGSPSLAPARTETPPRPPPRGA